MTRTLRLDGCLTVLRTRLDPSARGSLEARDIDGVPLLTAALPGALRLAFTTRHGGRSRGRYAALDLSPDQGDDPAAVSANRERLGAVLARMEGGRETALTLVSPRQEHGVRVVGTAEYAARGEREGCDGLTIRPPLDDGLAALLLFADCVPVVLVGEVDMAVVHGGWRGLLSGVVQQGARAMTGPPGAAFVGPSIGPCCFTVGDEVAEAFTERYGPEVVLPGPRVDLWGVASRALAEVEVPAVRVTNPRLCTRCNRDLFYSYRAEGPTTGRQGAVIWSAEPRSRPSRADGEASF